LASISDDARRCIVFCRQLTQALDDGIEPLLRGLWDAYHNSSVLVTAGLARRFGQTSVERPPPIWFLNDIGEEEQRRMLVDWGTDVSRGVDRGVSFTHQAFDLARCYLKGVAFAAGDSIWNREIQSALKLLGRETGPSLPPEIDPPVDLFDNVPSHLDRVIWFLHKMAPRPASWDQYMYAIDRELAEAESQISRPRSPAFNQGKRGRKPDVREFSALVEEYCDTLRNGTRNIKPEEARRTALDHFKSAGRLPAGWKGLSQTAQLERLRKTRSRSKAPSRNPVTKKRRRKS
jgi:hypothetical protein